MNPHLTQKYGRLTLKLIMVAGLIVFGIALTRKVQEAYLDYQVKSMTEELKNLKVKSMCAGRFLIDVPLDAEVSYRGAMIAGWSISTYDETDGQFTVRVEEKEARLSSEKNEREMTSLERGGKRRVTSVKRTQTLPYRSTLRLTDQPVSICQT